MYKNLTFLSNTLSNSFPNAIKINALLDVKINSYSLLNILNFPSPAKLRSTIHLLGAIYSKYKAAHAAHFKAEKIRSLLRDGNPLKLEVRSLHANRGQNCLVHGSMQWTDLYRFLEAVVKKSIKKKPLIENFLKQKQNLKMSCHQIEIWPNDSEIDQLRKELFQARCDAGYYKDLHCRNIVMRERMQYEYDAKIRKLKKKH